MKKTEFEGTAFLKSGWKKVRMIMKLTIFLIFLGLTGVSASVYSQSKKLTLNVENGSIREVFDLIESQSEFVFIYKKNVIDPARKVNLKVKKLTIDKVLDKLFRNSDTKYEILNRQIILTPDRSIKAKPVDIQSVLQLEQPQQKEITGKVTDENGLPLPGVSVIVKGTTIGTVTNNNGEFSLNVSLDAEILQFSFVGMKTQEISIEGRTTFTVVMEEDIVGIEEVVATAFGIKRTQRELTYSTQQVGGEDLVMSKNSDMLSSMQGKVAGVSINLTSGEVGRTPQIRIRGNRSLRNNNPLYVIDGMPVPGLTDFDPNNIESINILKGPTASALYGLEASNGVIIITSKSGEGFIGDPTISFDTHYSVDNPGYLAPLQTVFAQGTNGEFNQNTWQTWGPRISEMEPYTNQFGEIEQPGSYENDKDFYRTGGSLNNSISIKNAGEFGNYIVSVGDNRQTGIVPNSKYNRTSVMMGGNIR